jgi:hypothetical protein
MQRIKGQETVISIVRDGVLEAELTDIQSFNATLMLELIQQGYLGETSDRFDEVFKGSKFDFEMHHHSQDWVTFNKALIDRARRRTPNVVINVQSTFNFPNGDTPTWAWPDAFFGEVGVNLPGRAEYMKTKYQGGCSEPDLTTG